MNCLQGPLNSALDNLEKKLEESGGPFLCGGKYTLADCLFTCVLARLGMISMLGETFKSRPVDWKIIVGFIFLA